jgi:hypothetical protein
MNVASDPSVRRRDRELGWVLIAGILAVLGVILFLFAGPVIRSCLGGPDVQPHGVCPRPAAWEYLPEYGGLVLVLLAGIILLMALYRVVRRRTEDTT